MKIIPIGTRALLQTFMLWLCMTGILPFCLFIPESIRSSLFHNENKRESPFWGYLKNWTFDLEVIHGNIISAAPKDGFLLNALKTLFMLSRVLFDLQKCILSGARKFVSVRSSYGNSSLSKLQGLQCYFPENFRYNLKVYESEDFSDSSSLHRISESEKFRFLFLKKKKA